MLRGDLGYGDGYGGKPLPFFKAFYAGGVGSVRGYESSSLGPRDIFGNVARRQAQDRRQRRAVLSDPEGRQVGARERVRRRRPDLRERRPAGVRERSAIRRASALAWNSPIGPLKFSYAVPLNEKPGDKIQKFQFQVGSVF